MPDKAEKYPDGAVIEGGEGGAQREKMDLFEKSAQRRLERNDRWFWRLCFTLKSLKKLGF